MTKLAWNAAGQRTFEAGLDRGVLYVDGKNGVPWNGLTSVADAPTGGEPRAYYMDGVRHRTDPGPEEYEGTIEAFMYPPEFEACDGTEELLGGFQITQQKRMPFHFTYRTKVGNDTQGLDHAYKLHLIYNALVKPTTRNNTTLGETVTPGAFSWAFTTTPVGVTYEAQIRRFAHIILDSRRVSGSVLRNIEDFLYGSPIRDPKMITFAQLMILFGNPTAILRVIPDEATGIAALLEDDNGDMSGAINTGIYDPTAHTRLRESQTPGLFTLDP